MTSRALAGAIALIAALSIIVQPLLRDGAYLANLGGMVRYFTIWGNIAACLAMGWIAFGGRISRAMMASLAAALAVIGLVYWGLLAGYHNPTGFARITNQVHHTFVPVATIVWWLRYSPPLPKIAPALPVIMAPPLTYGAFSLAVGELTGFYPYFFVNLPELGWTQFLLNNLFLALFFAGLGAVMIAAKRALVGRSNPPSLA